LLLVHCTLRLQLLWTKNIEMKIRKTQNLN
jgi:hypothetical protein